MSAPETPPATVRGTRRRRLRHTVLSVAAAGLIAPLLMVPTAASAAEPGSPEDHPMTVVLALGADYAITNSPDELMQRARDQVEDLRQFWLTQTDGKVDIRLESIEWADVDNDGATDSNALCYVSGSQASQRSDAAQKDVGWIGGPRRHFFYLVVAGCRNDGTGSSGSASRGLQNGGWLDGAQGGPNDTVKGPLSHEMGHNFSLQHADTYVCAGDQPDGEPITQGGTCFSTEYADAVELMSGSLAWSHKNISAPNTIRLGILGADDYLAVTGDFRQEVTIQTRDLHAGVRAVKITDPISGRDYFVEYATPVGFNASVPTVDVTRNGLPYRVDYGVRVQRMTAGNHTGVLAAPPRPDPDGTVVRHFSWAPGQTFVSPSGGVSVNVVSTTATTATLSIRTRADVVAPDPAASLTTDGRRITGTAEAGTTVTITDPNGTVVGTAAVSGDGTFTTTLSPAQSPGTLLSTTVTDPSGNVSAVATVAVPILAIDVESAHVHPGQGQRVFATGFLPGEQLTLTVEPGSAAVATGIADAQGDAVLSWTIPATAVAGAYEAVLTGAASGGVRGEFEVTAPVAPVIDPASGPVSATPTLTGTGQPGATVDVVIDGKPAGSALVGSDGKWSLTTKDVLSAGPHEISATQTDSAGNTSPATKVTITVAAPDADRGGGLAGTGVDGASVGVGAAAAVVLVMGGLLLLRRRRGSRVSR